VTFILIGFLAGCSARRRLGQRAGAQPDDGAPLKISVATSKFLLSITDTSAAWIYINNGAVLPIMVVPRSSALCLARCRRSAADEVKPAASAGWSSAC